MVAGGPGVNHPAPRPNIDILCKRLIIFLVPGRCLHMTVASAFKDALAKRFGTEAVAQAAATAPKPPSAPKPKK